MKKLSLFFLLMALNLPILIAQIYVTEAGAGSKDGTSWANAYEGTQLQQAINEAETVPIKQVWVAKGTYKPTEKLSEVIYTTSTADILDVSSDRDMAFILKTGVEVYGGFAGGETSITDRVFPLYSNPNLNETILSGDLGIPDDNSDNSYHVISARNDADGAVLDGFTIRDGNANHGSYAEIDGGSLIRRSWGGGISVYSNKHITFKNLMIQNNYTNNAGGGVSIRAVDSDGKFDFEKVVFQDNESDAIGGAFYSYGLAGTPSLNIANCIFIRNKGAGSTGGGALYHSVGTGTDYILNIINSEFRNNETADTYGGAIRLNSGTAYINSTLFEANTAASRGGAIYSTGGSTLNLDGCTFDGNTSTTGGHYYIFNGTGNITNTIFKNGNASGNGGAIYVASGTVLLTISNSEFYLNTAQSGGGVLYTTSNVSIAKSKLFSNTAEDRGGALYIYSSSTSNSDVRVNNSLLYNNTANGIGTTNHGGGAVYISRAATGQLSSLTAINTTFYSNKSPNSPHGAISFNGTSNVTINLYNNIFNDNMGSEGPGDVRGNASATQTYSYNLFQNPISSSGNRIVVIPYYLDGTNPQPLFASITEGDYNFLWPIEDSFAIDKGDDALYTSNVSDVATAKDFLDNDRLEGSSIDLGAIEWGVVLPVQVSSFTANLVNGRTQLKWSVGTEDNVNRYEVERSQNGTDFIKVAEVPANGSSSYSTTDNSPAPDVNYYRLVTVDNDGSQAIYKEVRSVKVSSLSAQAVQVYPNPVRGSEASVSLGSVAAGNYGYQVVNTSGQVVQQGSVDYDGSSGSIAVADLPEGTYIIYVSIGTQTAQTKFIRQ